MKPAILALVLFASYTLHAFDFRPYTVIDSAMKSYLRANWQANGSAITHGVVHGLGNSITYTMAFWAPYNGNANPGPVPGTTGSSYADKTCAYSGYRIDNGLACLSDALALHPEVVICEYGTNDLNDKSVGNFPSQYRNFIDQILATGCIPIISTIPPCRWNNDASYDPVVLEFNDSIKAVAMQKNVPLVDFWQAWMDYTAPDPWRRGWWGDSYVHPSGCDNAMMTDTTLPLCGYGIRNAVTWQAVNKVYRIVIDNGPADAVSAEKNGVAPLTEFAVTAFPNPFNPVVNITVSNRSHPWTQVCLKILSINGQLVTDLTPMVQKSANGNERNITWNAASQPSGIYLAWFSAGQASKTRLIILKK